LVPNDSDEAAEDEAAERQLDRTRGSEEIELEAEQVATQRPASQPPSARSHAPAPVGRKLEDKPKQTAPEVPQDTLNQELVMLDRARTHIAGGRGTQALGVLSDYQEQFPRGRLALEAEVMRIEALAAAGNGALARTRAKAFLQRHPKSLLAPRVERFVR
jgi:hypothetical protein